MDVFARVVDACQHAIASRNQRFDANLPGRALPVIGDEIRLTQAFTNLVQNASKYTPNHGVIVLSCNVEDAGDGSESVLTSIEDNGIGITAETLPLIFEPFVQDLHAVGFAKDGLGIGLTLVRDLVHAHGGKVTASSAGQGMGSKFTVQLPLS